MSVAAPIWLGVAGLVAVGVVIAHLISTSVPDRDLLPTVRFVPEGAPLTVLRTRRLTDLLLLALRVLAVALLGVALAGVEMTRDAPPRVVIADMSRAVGSFAEVRDSVAGLSGAGAVIVEMDSVARAVPLDSLVDGQGSARPASASLSAALVAAHRAIAEATGDRENTELVIVSPLVREQIDSATAPLLALWPGAVRHVSIRPAPAPATESGTIRATGDDPVAATLEANPAARVAREAPTAEDSAWAADGGALVVWPAKLQESTLQRRAAADTQYGVAVDDHVVIGSFARSHDPRAGQPIAFWIDGAPAATEAAHGDGCIREVAIPVDAAGDIALRDNFRRLALSLARPCGGSRDFASISLADLGVTGRASTERQSPPSAPPSLPTREGLWLGLAALAVLIAEQLLRRRTRVA